MLPRLLHVQGQQCTGVKVAVSDGNFCVAGWDQSLKTVCTKLVWLSNYPAPRMRRRG